VLAIAPYLVTSTAYVLSYRRLYRRGAYTTGSQWVVDMVVPLLTAALTPLVIVARASSSVEDAWLWGAASLGVLASILVLLVVGRASLLTLTSPMRWGPRLTPAQVILGVGQSCIVLSGIATVSASL
jgi:hypothetical protein